MHEVNRTKLIEQLLALHSQQDMALVDSADRADLREQIAKLVDQALDATQEVDSRRVTILLSDLRGFTSVAENYTPLEMVEALNRYFKRMSEIIIRHGGTIDKFMGDSIMALFGAPVRRDDDIEAALACAIEMQMAMGEINQQNVRHGMAPLYMGIGINTGVVVAGRLGSTWHSEYTVIGDHVNLAARVEAHSLRGQILLSENTYLEARGYIDVGNVNEVKVKGKKDTVRFYELLSMRLPRPLIAPPREVRNSPRADVDMPFTFQIVDGKSVLAPEYVGRVVDISYGGMYIASPVPIELFCDIKIALSLAFMGSEFTEIYAKVVRVSPADPGVECSIEFTSINSTAALAIKEFVDSIVELHRR